MIVHDQDVDVGEVYRTKSNTRPAHSGSVYGTSKSLATDRLTVTINRVEYQHGYLKMLGKVDNVGGTDAFSPTR